MKYTTYKSKYERQGIPAFVDKGKKRFVSFERNTLMVAEDDINLKEQLDGIMAREKEFNLPRTIFTPEEFTELAHPDMAYLEHKDRGQIPLKTVYKMIDFAIEKGFEDKTIKTNKIKVEQGTKFTKDIEKELK